MPPTQLMPFTTPDDIERRSLAIIDGEVAEPRPFAGTEWLVVRRMIHTSADFELLSLTAFHPRAVEAGLAALAAGATIVTDTRMAQAGIPLRRIQPLGGQVVCLMDDAEVTAMAQTRHITRARAAVEIAAQRWPEAIYVVGNAPTALLAILEEIDAGRLRPALVVGMPVGFVNAAESKELFCQRQDVPWITIRGRKGGSALAASVINALAEVLLAQGRTGCPR